jgi:hypothetical protein
LRRAAKRDGGAARKGGAFLASTGDKIMRFTQAELINYVHDELAYLDGEEAYDVIETVIDRVIAALRADRSIPARTLAQWEDFFLDATKDAARDLRYLDGLIKPREAIWAIENFFDDRSDSTDAKPSAPQASAEAS